MGVLTVFTDASYSPATRVAGGAYWAVCTVKGTKVTISGTVAFPNVAKPSHAEIITASEALRILSEHPVVQGWLDEVRHNRMVVMVVDALCISHAASGMDGHHHITESLNMWQRRLGAKVKINHVKAHTTNKDARSYVNRWCDKNAAMARANLESRIRMEAPVAEPI